MSRIAPTGLLLLLMSATFATAQTQAPAPASVEALRKGLAELQAALKPLPPAQRGTIDAEVCAKTVEWLLEHEEYYKGEETAKQAQQVLQLGMQRVAAIKSGKANWDRQGRVPLAFRSAIDGTVQPYVLSIPAEFDGKADRKWPLYVVLHGRQSTSAEPQFIANSLKKDPVLPTKYIQLEVYGRGNNAYRWAGETDVFEAIADVQARFPIDDQRITIWGFSMGGAGAWQFALHHPSRWASAGAGAGFVDYYHYTKKTDRLVEFQHRSLNIYDSIVYARNLSAVPMVGYGGQIDPQLLAAREMYEQSVELNVPLSVIVGAGMGHKFDPASRDTFQAFLDAHNSIGLPKFPGRKGFEFVTYTLKYNTCEWMTIEEVEVPYAGSLFISKGDPPDVPARNARGGNAAKPKKLDGLEVTTENVAAFSIVRGAGDKIRIDNAAAIEIPKGNAKDRVYFVKAGGKWSLLDSAAATKFQSNPDLHKRHDLQGPIDDAFMSSFVCVRGTGTPWSPNLENYSQWVVERFDKEFAKYYRGRPIVKADRDLLPKEIQESNLVLLGDPGSNSVLAKVVDQLPLQWTKDSITFNGQTYSTKDHAVVLIFPNPLNPKRYVVINSGMSLHASELSGTNALHFPRLGDHSVLQFSKNADGGYSEKPVVSGIFDAQWKFEK
ncbi:alpha/beta hydrolase-fold protein [Planctomicrobium sp. SH664]|uniref:alpha/beta hydrolase-fold protein n=1 Tax=Planctomicrobium sp. SH664 TaxID=3448125 RepID=UPI003F5BAEA8